LSQRSKVGTALELRQNIGRFFFGRKKNVPGPTPLRRDVPVFVFGVQIEQV